VSDNNENISLDEMMRNLKRGAVKKQAIDAEAGEREQAIDTEVGERVIRADGSEVIKVRSKKRRSVQPKQEVEKKKLRRNVVMLTSMISVLFLLIIAYSFFLGYYNGNKFKSSVSQSLVNMTGALN